LDEIAKHAKIIKLLREKIRAEEYEFTIPHFFEEMANDNLIFADIETAITTGVVNRVFSDDPRSNRYELVGQSSDGRQVAVVCGIKGTGKLLFITTWEIYE